MISSIKKAIDLLTIAFVSLSCAGKTIPCGDSIPIIYSDHYNLSVLGIENFHPFDAKKYGKVYNGLVSRGLVCRQQLSKPSRATDEELLLVHTPEYLASLRKSSVIADIVEIPPLKFLPSRLLRNGILEPMRLATGGTILGVRLALRYGWAINLSGGFHHAKADRGEGFCVFADVPIALHSIWKTIPDLKVLIVDLDAHQGNGNASILGNDPRVAIFDMYNAAIFPHDNNAIRQVKYRIPLHSRTNTLEYLDTLGKWLPIAIKNENPGLIVYNAGTDVYCADPLGNLSVSEQGIIDRDNFVLDNALENKIPVLVVLSGGYNRRSGEIIAKSVETFLKNREK